MVLKILAVVAAIAFFLYAFTGFVRWTCAEWKKIEAEEAARRRFPALRKRGGN